MKYLTTILISLTLSCFLVANGQAATDYNSSRSNKADVASAPEELNNLLNKATADARRIGKRIINIEADGEEGAGIIVKVTVKVEVCKITKDCQQNSEPETNISCACNHL